MSSALKKTNVLRALDAHKIAHDYYEYDTKDGKIDAVSVAEKLGKNPRQVFKTLVTSSSDGRYFVFCVPSMTELDLKAAAKAVNCKRVEMIPLKQLLSVTGYVHGGCSPIGMKKEFPTVIDSSCLAFDDILVSAGKVGVNVRLNVRDLLNFVKAATADIVKKQEDEA